MLGKLIKHGQDSRESILKGIREAKKTICATLGPRGHTVLIDKGTKHPVITKDGVTVSKAISFSDPWMNIGALLVQSAASRTNREAGDGTTSTSFFVGEFSEIGNSLVTKGADSNEVRLGFEAASRDIIEEVKKYITKVSSDDDIKHIATISGNNDPEIGNTILEAFSGIGEDGVISVKDSYNGNTEIKFSTGLQYDEGFYNGFYANEGDKCIFKNGGLVVIDNDVSDLQEIKSMLMWSTQSNTPLVMIVNSLSTEVGAILATQVKEKKAKICVLKSPALNKAMQSERLQDIAAYFGIKMVGTEETPFTEFNPSDCVGMFETLEASPSKTIIQGVEENEETLEKRINELKEQLHVNDNDPEHALTEKEKEVLKERIAKLTGGIATIFVGGNSVIEIKERIDRYEDALNAVRAGISDGIVPGGGTALLKAAYNLRDKKFKDKTDDFNLGYKSYVSVCKKLAKEIMSNVLDADEVELTAAKIAESKDKFFGFDAKAGILRNDLVKDGIIDPFKVVQCSIKNATSTAALFLTTDSCITDEPNNLSLESNDPIMDDYNM